MLKSAREVKGDALVRMHADGAPATSEIKTGQRQPVKGRPSWRSWLGGIGFTLVIAILGLGASRLAGLERIGPLACAILIAVLYRQVAGYPERLRAGIQFSAKRLLRVAIILYGLKLNVDVIQHQGLGLLLRDAVTITFSVAAMLLLAKWLYADRQLSFLLGVGTGVCGAAAIAAVSPIVRAKEEDTALGVGIIALMGTLFAIAYSLLHPVLALTASDYGVWCGVSLHEIAQVALAAAPAGGDALAMALLAKLGRVFLLIPFSFGLVFWMKRKERTDTAAAVEFPWFLVGFVGMSLLGSYVLGKYVLLPAALLNGVNSGTTVILSMAMVGLGLNVSFGEMRARALRPLIAMTLTSVLLSVLTLAFL